MAYTLKTIFDGIAYPECPRWHSGHLWVSDQHGGNVHCLTSDGQEVDRFAVPGSPSGLGWLPNGDLLIVSMEELCLFRRSGGALSAYADLSMLHVFHSNDMVVDKAGRAYVGNIGFDFNAGEAPVVANLALVDTDRSVRLAASDLLCPNGAVISSDGKRLTIAESLAGKLTAFDIATDGTLSNRRVVADVAGHVPDGICLDVDGNIWAASPYEAAVIRINPAGDIVDRIEITGANPYACMLGGEDGCSLFICCAPHHDPAETLTQMGGRIEVTQVDTPGAGWP